MKKQVVYLDYAATTPVDSRVIKVMLPYFNEKFGNTMSLHQFGQRSKQALEKSREIIADSLGVDSKEVIFTSSATESNNMALKGLAFLQNKGHLIISQIEHSCVKEAAGWLEKRGFVVTRIPVNKEGFINLDLLKKSIRKDTFLVSIIHANNEIGVIQDIEAIGKICRSKGVLFHTDAAQSFGKIGINARKMNIDLLTASSQKMYGPKGAACLFVRQGLGIEPLLHGGGHEFGLRSGTVNIPAIVGFAKSVELCNQEMKKEAKRLAALRDRLIKNALKIKGVYLNGSLSSRLPNNASFRFSSIEGESILMHLDSKGVLASTASACASTKLQPSHVLLAIGLKPEQAHGSLRFSLGRWTTRKEIDYVIKILPEIVEKLRELSPLKKYE